MAALVKFTESHPNARKLMMIFSTNITELSAFQASQLSVDLVKVRERMQEFRVRFSRFNYDDISYDEKRVLLLTTRNFSQIASGKALFSGLGP